jgi:hypothetical protein
MKFIFDKNKAKNLWATGWYGVGYYLGEWKDSITGIANNIFYDIDGGQTVITADPCEKSREMDIDDCEDCIQKIGDEVDTFLSTVLPILHMSDATVQMEDAYNELMEKLDEESL